MALVPSDRIPDGAGRSFILRCWEDRGFVARSKHSSAVMVDEVPDPATEIGRDKADLHLEPAQIRPCPVPELHDDSIILAFWEGVFAPIEPPTEPERVAANKFQVPVLKAESIFEPAFRLPADDAMREMKRFGERHPWLALAIPGLEAGLVSRLSSIASLPLYLWIAAGSQPIEAAALATVHKSHPHAASQEPSAALRGVISEYPELDRLLRETVAHWLSAGTVFLQRLVDDRERLAEFLRLPELVVESVTPGLSDNHDHGRTVIRVAFRGGLCVAYKPRSLEAEKKFVEILFMIGAWHPELQLPFASVLARGSHGWMTWLTPIASEDPGGWYRDAGGLQCLLQMFGIADAHLGNCVAVATGPALIDCECILTPRWRSKGSFDSTQANRGEPGIAEIEAIDSSDMELERTFAEIRATAFLPDPLRVPGEPDLSGIFGRGGQGTGYRIPVWSGGGPEGIHLSFHPAVLSAQSNLLPEGSPPIAKMAASEAFLGGFAEMSRCLLAHRDDIATLALPLRKVPARVLLRNTRRYIHILSQSLQPRFLRDREARRQRLRSLLSEEMLGISGDAERAILDSEVEALDRLDVPFFHAIGRDLYSGGRVVERDFFSTTGNEALSERLQSLGMESLDRTLQGLRLLWIMAL